MYNCWFLVFGLWSASPSAACVSGCAVQGLGLRASNCQIDRVLALVWDEDFPFRDSRYFLAPSIQLSAVRGVKTGFEVLD